MQPTDRLAAVPGPEAACLRSGSDGEWTFPGSKWSQVRGGHKLPLRRGGRCMRTQNQRHTSVRVLLTWVVGVSLVAAALTCTSDRTVGGSEGAPPEASPETEPCPTCECPLQECDPCPNCPLCRACDLSPPQECDPCSHDPSKPADASEALEELAQECGPCEPCLSPECGPCEPCRLCPTCPVCQPCQP